DVLRQDRLRLLEGFAILIERRLLFKTIGLIIEGQGRGIRYRAVRHADSDPKDAKSEPHKLTGKCRASRSRIHHNLPLRGFEMHVKTTPQIWAEASPVLPEFGSLGKAEPLPSLY